MTTPFAAPEQYWPQQSPIELYKRDSFYVKVSQRYFKHKYKGAPYLGSFQGEAGHANFVLDPLGRHQKAPMVRLGGERAELKKIHLHTPTEHDLEGKNLGGEIHLLHEIVAPKGGSKFIVLGVFFEEDSAAPDHPVFHAMYAAACGQQGHSGSYAGKVAIHPDQLMPNTDRWYRYEGSLTTEPFSEIVSWLVFIEPLKVSSNDLKVLKQCAHQPERLPQPINRRFVLRNFR